MGLESYRLGCLSNITQDIVAVNRFGALSEAEVLTLGSSEVVSAAAVSGWAEESV